MESPSTYRHARGFTLVEVLVVISLMAVVMGLGLLMSIDVFRGTTFRSTRQVLVSALTTARSRALANMYQSPEGVCYSAPDFIIFRRSSYGSANSADEHVPGNPSISLTGAINCTGMGAGAVVFSQIAATTSGSTITISETGHPNATVSVNTEGTIVW